MKGIVSRPPADLNSARGLNRSDDLEGSRTRDPLFLIGQKTSSDPMEYSGIPGGQYKKGPLSGSTASRLSEDHPAERAIQAPPPPSRIYYVVVVVLK